MFITIDFLKYFGFLSQTKPIFFIASFDMDVGYFTLMPFFILEHPLDTFCVLNLVGILFTPGIVDELLIVTWIGSRYPRSIKLC